MRRRLWTRGLCTAVLAMMAAPLAWAAGELLLVSGRWDSTVLVIDLGKAMDPANDGTPNAIVNRVRVTPDIDAKGSGVADTPASGQPVNVVLSPDRRHAYVVNHSGSVTPEAAQKFQHGHAGTVTILDVARTLDPANAGTLKAVEAIVPMDGFGPVGLAVTPDGKHALVSASEGDQLEDGGRTISIIDLASRKVGWISSFTNHRDATRDLHSQTERMRRKPEGVVVVLGAVPWCAGFHTRWLTAIRQRRFVIHVEGR